MSKLNVAAFDFDGTITRGDTLIELFRFTHGIGFFFWFLLLSPILVLYKLNIIGNDKAKQIVFSCFYRRWTIQRFEQACANFALTIRVRPKAMACLKEHLDRGDRVFIVSASPENWVRIWAENHGVFEVLGTKLDVVDQRLTGRFASPNCYGDQKVVRLSEALAALATDRKSIFLTAYGDSSGDKSMLEFADQGYYKNF